MSRHILSGAVFNPGAKTLDLSAVAGFSPGRLLTVIHRPTNEPLYLLGGGREFSGTWAGSVLTLAASTVGMSSGDPLTITISDEYARFHDEAINQPMSANQQYVGQMRDAGENSRFTGFIGMIFSNQPGTLQIFASRDAGGSIQYVQKQIAVPANTFLDLEARLACRYMRLVFQNQANAGSINMQSAFLA